MTILSPLSATTSGSERFSWDAFVSAVARYSFSHPGQRLAYMAQCILESGAGTSRLFREAGNPTGLKWRDEMADISSPLTLITPTEPQGVRWCSWSNPQGAIDGYRRFIQRDRYQGWEAFGHDPEAYIRHIASRGYATDPNYIIKVKNLFPQARLLLETALNQPISADGSTSQVDQILIDLSSSNELIVYAKAGDFTISSLKSAAKVEVSHFLSRHSTALRIKASPAVKVIAEQDLQMLTTSNSDARWLQFWQCPDGKVVLLGMVNGTPVSAVKSEEIDVFLKFLSSHPGASTVQGANLGSSLDWNQFGHTATVPDPDPDHGHDDHPSHDDGHSSSSASLRPRIQWVDGCRNFSSRNGKPIDAIVLHYTTSRSVDGAISWFKTSTGDKAVSAHYIVGLDGVIFQLVKDSDKAWHCYGFNTSSIGIEHVAQAGDRLTPEQEQASSALLRWLIAEYRISPERIYGHRWNPAEPGGTPCPGSLWRTPEELKNWVKTVVLSGSVAIVPARKALQHSATLARPPVLSDGFDPRGSEEAGMIGPKKSAPMQPGDSYLLVNDRDQDMEAYDHTGALLWKVPCLARGQGVDNQWTQRNSDTPPGLYKLGKVYRDYEKNSNPPCTDIAMGYGWYSFDMIELENQEASNNRAGIMLHGGGSACGWPGAWSPNQNLFPTLGCIRLKNIDLRDKVLPLYEKGTVYIGVFQEA